MQKIYIEMVFLDNFIVNLLILLLSSMLTGTKKRWGRIAASAAIGGVYACAVFGANGFQTSFVIKTTVSAVMCLIAYYAKNEKHFWKNVCAFYITSFVFAGAIYGITFCLGQPETFGGAVAVKPLISYILIGLALGIIMISIFGRVHKRTIKRESGTAEVCISYGGHTAEVNAFIDTGNILTEPLSGLGVVFVSAAAGKEIFDKHTLDLLNCRGGPPTDRLRIIPCMTASGAGVFYGIEIDEIMLKGQQERVKAVVCIAKGTLAYGSEAVIGSSILDELMKGAGHDKVFCEKDSSMDTAAVGNSAECGLYKRQRGSAAAADAAGRKFAAAAAGQGGQGSQAGPDRA